MKATATPLRKLETGAWFKFAPGQTAMLEDAQSLRWQLQLKGPLMRCRAETGWTTEWSGARLVVRVEAP